MNDFYSEIGSKTDKQENHLLFTVDASVGIKWFSSENEDKVEIAQILQEKNLAGEIEIIVPDLFFFEIINSFLYKKNSNSDSLLHILDSLKFMHMQIVYPDMALMEDVLKIAYKQNITFYDALYVAVAKKQDCILLTEDKKLLACNNDYKFIKNLDYLLEVF
jgi:predicted nucleic acid-binding protein